MAQVQHGGHCRQRAEALPVDLCTLPDPGPARGDCQVESALLIVLGATASYTRSSSQLVRALLLFFSACGDCQVHLLFFLCLWQLSGTSALLFVVMATARCICSSSRAQGNCQSHVLFFSACGNCQVLLLIFMCSLKCAHGASAALLLPLHLLPPALFVLIC